MNDLNASTASMIAVVLPRGAAFDPSRPTSIETVVRTLLAESRFRDRVTVICDAGAEGAPGRQVLTVPGGLDRRRRRTAVLELLRELRPRLVEHHQELGSGAILARALPRARHLLHRHTRVRPPAGPVDRLRQEHRLRGFDRLLFVSDWARREFLNDYPGLSSRTSTLANAVDGRAWTADPARREPVVCFCGRATPEKGLDVFCAALVEVLEASPTWRGALLLGEWERHANWAGRHVAALARFGPRVELHRSASPGAVGAVMRRAAIVAVPSRVNEAMGLAALEAHAAGAAVISSGRGGLREASGPHALYCAPEATALARAMRRLIADPDFRRALATGGQRYVATRHVPALRAAELDVLRDDLLAAPPGPSRLAAGGAGPGGRP